MPIFIFNGEEFDVDDVDIQEFAEEYPDAKAKMTAYGKEWNVKAQDYQKFLDEIDLGASSPIKPTNVNVATPQVETQTEAPSVVETQTDVETPQVPQAPQAPSAPKMGSLNWHTAETAGDAFKNVADNSVLASATKAKNTEATDNLAKVKGTADVAQNTKGLIYDKQPYTPSTSKALELAQFKAKNKAMFDSMAQRTADMGEYYTKSGANVGKVVEAAPEYNAETGEFDTQYITPTLNREDNKAIADAEAREYKHWIDVQNKYVAPVNMTTSAQLRRAKERLRDVDEKIKERTAQLDAEHEAKRPSGFLGWLSKASQYASNAGVGGPALATASDRFAYDTDDVYQSLRLAQRKLQEEIQQLENKEVNNQKGERFWADFGRHAGQTLTSVDLWDFGVNSIKDARTISQLAQKVENSETLTDAEETALYELYMSDAVKNHVGDLGDGARWGEMGAHSLAFGAQLLLTGGGFGNLSYKGASWLAKGAVKAVAGNTKSLGLKLAEQGLFKTITGSKGAFGKLIAEQGVGRTISIASTRALGVGAENLLVRAPLVVGTVQSLGTTAKTIESKYGPVYLDNETGDLRFVNDNTWGKAAWETFADASIEVASEMSGATKPALTTITKAFGARGLTAAILRATRENAGTVLSKSFNFLERMGVNGIFGEGLEEYDGQAWRTILRLESAKGQDGENLIYDPAFHWDIWGGITLTAGLTSSAVTGVGYGIEGVKYGVNTGMRKYWEHQVDKASAQASRVFSAEQWENMRQIIDATDNADMSALAQQTLADNSLSENQKHAALTYMERSMNLRGYNLGRYMQSKNGMLDADAEAVNQSYADGYESNDAQEMADARKAVEVEESKLRSALSGIDQEGVNAIMADVVADPVTAMQRVEDEALRDAIADYANAKAVYDGMQQRVADDIDTQIAVSDATIDRRTNRNTGKIQRATLKNDKKVYVVGGTLNTTENGSVDFEHSDESIIVMDETGALEYSSPKNVLSIDNEIDPVEEKAISAETIRQQAQAEAEANMSGKLTFTAGEQVNLKQKDGTFLNGTIVGPYAEDGKVFSGLFEVETQDGTKLPFEADVLQSWADEARQARVEQFDAERQAQRDAIAEQQAALEAEAPVAEEETKPLVAEFNQDDVFTIDINGEDMSGTVLAPINDDGLVEVLLNTPNGEVTQMMTPDVLNVLLTSYNGVSLASEEAPIAEGATTLPEVEATEVPEVMEEPQSALDRVPTDKQGNPIYEQVDAETAWDAIVEQTQGDVAMAQTVADDMVKDKEKALKAAQNAKSKGGATIAEKIASEQERKANIQNAEQELAIWQAIASVPEVRQQAMAEAQAQAEAERIKAEEAETTTLPEGEETEEGKTPSKSKSRKAPRRAVDAEVEILRRLEEEWSDAPKDVKEQIKELADTSVDMTVEEVVYRALENIKKKDAKYRLLLTDEGVARGAVRMVGLSARELQKALGLNAFASRAKGGVSIEKLAEIIYQTMDKNIMGAHQIDDTDLRDMLIEAIRTIGKPSDLSYRRDSLRIEMAERLYNDWKEQEERYAEEQAYWDAQQEAFEYAEEEWLKAQVKALEDLPEGGFMYIFADEFIQKSKIRDIEHGQVNERSDNGDTILQGAQPDNTGRVEEGSEGRAVSEGIGDALHIPTAETSVGRTESAPEWEVGNEAELTAEELEASDKAINDGNVASNAIATDVAIGMLKDAGVEVVEATDAMAEAVLAKGGVQMMSVPEAKRRADAIENLTPININGNTKTKEELKEDYKNLPSVNKAGNKIQFYVSAFKKIYKEGGLFGQIIPQLDEILEQSVLAYSEADNLGGTKRPDGTIHKAHPNVVSFDNYVGKVTINGKEYYVRTTVKSQRVGAGAHSFFVTEVDVYEKSANGLSVPNFPSGESDHQRIIDAKLQQFFDYANGKANKMQFHIATESTAPFYSNAKKAVLDIKQDKATPQQWVAMLKKNGGLKAGEDAWLGLESWLSGQTGSVTKQEIIDYIDEHAIEIEEVNYGESEVSQFEDSDIYNEWAELGGDEDAFNEMIERYGDDFEMAFLYDEGQLYVADEDAASFFIDKGAETINETRLSYTTEGLTDNREIALTVPTIEPYNQNDDIHFGDAGGGRAVAWVRFGETKITKRIPDETAKLGYRVAPVRVLVIDEIQSVRHQDGREKGYRNEEIISLENRINSLHEKMYGEGLAPEEYRELTRLREEQREIIINANPELKAESEKVKELEKEYEALKKDNQSKLDSEGVELVRLQTLQEDARSIAEYDRIEKEIQDIKDAADKRKAELNEFFNVTIGNAYDKLHKGIRNDLSNQVYGVPVAPFEKNWHELAMKRMLRYAAENGYDKVAWTTGAQQAARYDMRQQVDNIQVEENNIEEFNDGTPIAKNITINTPRGNKIRYQADAEGNIRGGEYGGKNLKDVVGKELAEKIMQPGSFTIEEEGLAIGGEGMKGFYDKMLPSFVNKYTKKWGAKVGEVTMPSLEEGYQTMHSVDVTPQMKEDVMKGQPMFLRTPNGTVYGWTQGGKVFLIKEGMNAETPIHEYTHLWDKMVQQKNPELWNRGKELLKQTPTWNEVVNDKNYANIAHDEDAVASEVHSRLSGENGAKVLEQMIKDARKDGAMAVAKAASITERIKEWIKDMFAALKETLSAWSKQDLADLSIEDFNNLTLRDLAEGVNPNEYVTEEGDVQFMGSRVDKRKKDIEAKLNGIELSKSQKVVAEAYTTNANNLTIGFKDAKGKSRKIRFRQGNENKAGIKHSVFKHYQTNSNYFSADEILLIPQILEKGKRKQSGKDVTYELHINDAIFIVTTEMSGMAEEFTNFFTNRKPTVEEQGSSNTENQHEQPQQSVSQREVTQNSANSNSISANQDISFRIVDAVEEMVEDAKGANGEQKEAKYAEMDSTIEAADDISNTEEDDDVLYRDGEYLNFKAKYNLVGAVATAVIESEEDLLKLKNLIDEVAYAALENDYNKPYMYGGAYLQHNFIAIYTNKPTAPNPNLVWWHEQTHIAYERINLEDKHECGLTALEWLREQPWEGCRHYDIIIDRYKQEDWDSEASARLVEYIIEKYGVERFLSSDFGGNEKLSKLVTAIKNQIIYGKERPTEYDILRGAERTQRTQDADSRRNREGSSPNRNRPNIQSKSEQRGSREDSKGDSGNVRDIAERKGSGAVSDEGVTIASDPVSKAIGEPRYGRGKKMREYAERQRKFMVQKVQEIAQKLKLDNVEIVTDASTLSGKRAKAKGYFNPTTGKIVIVIPNHASVLDVEETVLHEAVAHYGLRKLFGKHFDTFLDNVYESADLEIRKKIAALAAKNGWDFRKATEEYLAMLAEDTEFESVTYGGWWFKVKELFRKMLDKLGLEDFAKEGLTLSDNELRYILFRSYQHLQGHRGLMFEAEDAVKQYELGVGNYSAPKVAESGEEGDYYRDGDFTPRDKVLARDHYEKVVSSGSYQFREAVQDSMLGLRRLYEAIDLETEIEDVAGFENAYIYENRMSSTNAGEQHVYFNRYMKPLLAEIGRICGASKAKRDALNDYLMAKHGLERNEYMRNKAEENGEDADRDFAGLTALTGEANWQAAEAMAQQIVDDFESQYDTTNLWELINNATKATLEKQYNSGVLSKSQYEEIRDMYEYYIPLRGWSETTSDKVYGYLLSNDGPLRGSIMKKAHGRNSKADDPIATIAMMADDGIRQGNRNLMKQRFLNFVLNHPSDAVSVSKLWLQYNEVRDEWVPVFPELTSDMTAEEVEAEVEAFEKRMKELAEQDPEHYKHGKEAIGVPYKVVNDHLSEHQIIVKRGGQTYVLTINGNPRAAQAINGLTNPDVQGGSVTDKLEKWGTALNRQLSAFYTTRNPDFVLSNFLRDMAYTNSMVWAKESPAYAANFHLNIVKFNPTRMAYLFAKWENGTLDRSNRIEDLFYQFMINGGETGYTEIKDLEKHKREIAKELKKRRNLGVQTWNWIGTGLDLINRSAENTARFAAFVTSKEAGRSTDRSIYDAKEISVNFNKKGAGSKMWDATGQTRLGKLGSFVGGAGRAYYVFFNAGVQGMANFGRVYKKHPIKMSAGTMSLLLLGYLVPMLIDADGDDDDKNAYYNLPDYVRRTHICIPAGESWITIPLPIEYRALYGLGELAYGFESGKEHYSDEELAQQIIAQFSQVLPIDMFGGERGMRNLFPSYAQPIYDVTTNTSWTGVPISKQTPFNEYAPEWQKAYQSTDTYLVDASRWLNEASGGNAHKKGAIDINPAEVEYLLESYLGGVYTFPQKMVKLGETLAGERELEWRNMPLANRVLKNGDERTAQRKLKKEYFDFQKKGFGEMNEEWRGFLKDYRKGDESAEAHLRELWDTPEFKQWLIFKSHQGAMKKLNNAIKMTDGEEQQVFEEEYYKLMREVVNGINDPDKFFKENKVDIGELDLGSAIYEELNGDINE